MEGEGGGRSGEWCHVYALEWCNVAGCGPVEIGRGFCGPGQNYGRWTLDVRILSRRWELSLVKF